MAAGSFIADFALPALKALAAQLLGWLAVAGLLLSGILPAPSLLAIALLQGGFAAAAALALKSARWWPPIHAGFSPALVLGSGLHIAPAWFLAAFLLLALVYWSSFRTQVPLYLSNRTTMQALESLLPEGRSLSLIDLGCGTGGLLAHLARARPDCRFEGVEAAPLPWLAARLATRNLPNCQVSRSDFWPRSLKEHDLVYVFLSPVPMPRLWKKARAEMRPGSLLVSNSFPVPEVEADQILTLPDRRATRLYLYRMPEQGKNGR